MGLKMLWTAYVIIVILCLYLTAVLFSIGQMVAGALMLLTAVTVIAIGVITDHHIRH